MYLKIEIRVSGREFLPFKYVVNVFFRNKTDDIVEIQKDT